MKLPAPYSLLSLPFLPFLRLTRCDTMHTVIERSLGSAVVKKGMTSRETRKLLARASLPSHGRRSTNVDEDVDDDSVVQLSIGLGLNVYGVLVRVHIDRVGRRRVSLPTTTTTCTRRTTSTSRARDRCVSFHRSPIGRIIVSLWLR